MRSKKIFKALFASAIFFMISQIEATNEIGSVNNNVSVKASSNKNEKKTSKKKRHEKTDERIKRKTKEITKIRESGIEFEWRKSEIGRHQNNLSYEELSGYLNTVRETIKHKKFKHMIKRFLLRRLDTFLAKNTKALGKILNLPDNQREEYSENLKKQAKDEKEIKIIDRLIDCEIKAEKNGFQDWSEGDWRIYWSMAFLYAADFEGLSEKIKEYVKETYDGLKF